MIVYQIIITFILAITFMSQAGATLAEDIPVDSLIPESESVIRAQLSAETKAYKAILKRAAGQDIHITNYSANMKAINQCPEFFDYTGYQNLRIPPKRVIKYVRAYQNEACYEVFYSEEWHISVLITNHKAGALQEIHFRPDLHTFVSCMISFADVNFDGYIDVLINIGGERGGIHYKVALLWKPEEGGYYREPTFETIPSPSPDPKNNLIWSGYDFSQFYGQNVYEFENNTFVNTHGLYLEKSFSDSQERIIICKEYMIKNGEWVVVNQQEAPFQQDSDTYSEIFPEVMDRFIIADAIWPGWEWCDPWKYFRMG